MARITILGLGLMGGSLWRKLAAEGHQVTGYDLDHDSREEARRVAAATSNRHADRVVDTIPAAVAAAEVVFMCVPVPDVEELLHGIHEAGYRGILTDVTSVKEPVRRMVTERYPATRWVGGHPMVGFERSGFFASNVNMYDDCPWVLCLDEDSRPASAMRDWLFLAKLLVGIGSRVVPMTAKDHDDAVARISHVPHIVAAALTQVVASGEMGQLSLTLGAGSFRDTTRVALTRPDRVAAFCGWNAEALAAELDQLIARLRRARARVRSADPVAELEEWLLPSNIVRNQWPPQPGSSVKIPPTIPKLLELGRAGGWISHIDDNELTGVLPAPISSDLQIVLPER